AVGVAIPWTMIVKEIVVPSIRRPTSPNPSESPGPGASLAPDSTATPTCAVATDARQKRSTKAIRTVLRIGLPPVSCCPFDNNVRIGAMNLERAYLVLGLARAHRR